jgi:hypothetical protein
MNLYKAKILVSGLAILLSICLEAFPQSTKKVSSKNHRHVSMSDFSLKEIAAEFSMPETMLQKDLARENSVTNATRTYDAFIVDTTRLFIKARKTGKTFEILGLPLGHRPFSDPEWLNNQILIFDRWAQPHYGTHYALNVKTGKLIKAAGFPDEVFLNQQKSKY